MSEPVLHPGAVGPAVAALQQALAERGLLPPEAAEEEQAQHFGPVTSGAIRTFQAKHQLAVDDVVGPATWAALTVGADAADEAAPPDYAHMPPLAQVALHVADEALRAGVREVPLGSNRGPKVDTILRGLAGDGEALLHFRERTPAAPDGWQGAPWCGRTARYCVDEAARRLGVASPVASWGDLASAEKWRAAGEAHGRLLPHVEPGAVGLILLPGGHGHVVLVAGVDGDSVTTREGNSANRLAARRRAVREFAAFVSVG